jgi:methyl-accepting chemotaxis protein
MGILSHCVKEGVAYTRSLLRLGGRPGAEPAGRAREDGIACVIASLDSLNRLTERDFLAIGGKLGGFLETAQRILNEIGVMQDLISGEAGTQSAAALADVLERSRGIDSSSGVEVQALASLRESSGSLRGVLNRSGETITMFRTVGTLIRIETARLGSDGSGLGQFADEVRKLAQDAEDRMKLVVEAAGEFDGKINSTLERTSKIEAGKSEGIPLVVEGVLRSLDALGDRRRAAAEVSARLGGEYGSLLGSLQDLVTNLQFHDITRQQIEHVIEALGDIQSGAVKGGLRLQARQLEAAARTFATSAGRIEDDLNQIAQRTRSMALEGKRLAGGSSADQESFFVDIERGCTAVLSAAADCSSAETDTWGQAIALGEMLGEMRQATDQIFAIDLQIQRLAWNAVVRAEHLGETGRALGVVAEAMQAIAAVSSERSASLGKVLDQMGQAVQELAMGTEGGLGQGPGELDTVLRSAIDGLHTSSERSFARMQQVVVFGERLSAEIEEARAGFGVAKLVERVCAEAGERIEVLGGGEEPESEPLAAFHDRYTMSMERDVHRRASDGEADGAAREEAVPIGCELGDNVELF